jgi:N-acylneuraminate cytidylyltransferase
MEKERPAQVVEMAQEPHLEVLALVPARGGSKSMPRKNLRVVGGKPMVSHSIDHALKTPSITRVILTTDDREIADVGQLAGAEVPFLRPSEYAQDLSSDYEFVHHALTWLRDNEQYEPDLVVQLRPTTPVRDIELIDRAIKILAERPDADSLRAVTAACFSPYKMWRLADSGFLSPILSHPDIAEPYNQARQMLPKIYQQDGFIDITRPRTIFEKGSLTGDTILPFYLDQESIDIDYENELVEAERIMRGE